MKFKTIPLFLATMALTACGSKEPTPVDPQPYTPGLVDRWEYLDFMSGENALRVDLFAIPEGLQFSYGNSALAQSVNTLTFNYSTKVTVNKNLESTDLLNLILVKDKKDGSKYSVDVNLAIEGNQLQEFLALDGNALTECDRVYITISYGTDAQWTKNLNTKLDQKIQERIDIIKG